MKHVKQAGQSTIEFILTFTFGLGIVFLFINVAINYSAGYLVHYATFMAARTYLTVERDASDGPNDAVAKEEARKTFARFRMQALGIDAGSVKPGGNGANGFHINPYFPAVTSSNRRDALYIGAYAVFEKPVSIFRLVAGGETAKYVSEAFLGKEPTRANCFEQTCKAIILGLTGNPTACGETSGFDFTVYDNGC